jgi:hypothetical protein
MRVDLVIGRREGGSLVESVPSSATGSGGGDRYTRTTSEEPLSILGSATEKRYQKNALS